MPNSIADVVDRRIDEASNKLFRCQSDCLYQMYRKQLVAKYNDLNEAECLRSSRVFHGQHCRTHLSNAIGQLDRIYAKLFLVLYGKITERRYEQRNRDDNVSQKQLKSSARTIGTQSEEGLYTKIGSTGLLSQSEMSLSSYSSIMLQEKARLEELESALADKVKRLNMVKRYIVDLEVSRYQGKGRYLEQKVRFAQQRRKLLQEQKLDGFTLAGNDLKSYLNEEIECLDLQKGVLLTRYQQDNADLANEIRLKIDMVKIEKTNLEIIDKAIIDGINETEILSKELETFKESEKRNQLYLLSIVKIQQLWRIMKATKKKAKK
ncbi:hypothetical protein GJ496_007634 [Pomphorhynchus laevis]|nr:hypothetical protein GJ496_007634 [Pomphorhynchus laevis]